MLFLYFKLSRILAFFASVQSQNNKKQVRESFIIDWTNLFLFYTSILHWVL